MMITAPFLQLPFRRVDPSRSSVATADHEGGEHRAQEQATCLSIETASEGCRSFFPSYTELAHVCKKASGESIGRDALEIGNGSLTPSAELAATRRAIFPGESDAYASARQALLLEEIDLRRQLAQVAEHRRALPPGPMIEKAYRFIDANGINVGLIDLFGEHETLVTYFWMYGPQRERPCPMCTNLLGPLDANASDIKQRAALKVLGRSPVERQLAFGHERGWANLDFVQTVGDDYARDIGVLTPEGDEYPALVVYRREGTQIRLFWAGEISGKMADPGQDPRGAPDLAPLWNVLDLTPGGRDPNWYPKLSY